MSDETADNRCSLSSTVILHALPCPAILKEPEEHPRKANFYSPAVTVVLRDKHPGPLPEATLHFATLQLWMVAAESMSGPQRARLLAVYSLS